MKTHVHRSLRGKAALRRDAARPDVPVTLIPHRAHGLRTVARAAALSAVHRLGALPQRGNR